MGRTSGVSSTQDLCGKWHAFVMRIVRGGVDDAMDFPDGGRDGDGRTVGSRGKSAGSRAEQGTEHGS
jgi:hypothetical protein